MGKKLTIEEMQRIAEEREGECLSTEYINAQTRLKWQCKKGHIWENTPFHIKQGQWCPYCYGRYQTLEDMQKIANEKGGQCLSEKYINSKTKLKWRCKEEHEWEATPEHIKEGTWCPICANKIISEKNRIYNIEDMKRFARERGGECLSLEFYSVKNKILWKCQEGHKWKAIPDNIIQGKWCPYCAGIIKATIEDMKNIAKEKKGICLSENYINDATKLKWQCNNGHEWEATPSNIKRGKWCPYCVGKYQTIEDMKKIAEERGGKCLSKEYIDAKRNLKWKCKNGHTWEASPDSIKRRSWCPICFSGLGERISRNVFEKIFELPFPSTRPKWLKNPETNQLLELDGYNKKLRLAFEYQGQQHYDENSYFSKFGDYEKQKERDQLKKQLCWDHNVVLIEIPYYIEYEDLPQFIVKECKKKNIKISENISKRFSFDTLKVYSPDILKELQELAQKRGGECLSNQYLGSNKKMKWKCKEGHIWETIPQNIKHGTWCPYCSGRHQNIDDMQKIAIKREGKCLSSEYINNTTKLKWRCKEGHEWEARPANIKSGKWCPICRRKEAAEKRRLTIEGMEKIAKEKGGVCLSNTYVNSGTKLRWKCKNGHEWEATPENIKSGGTWCPICARKKPRKYNIKMMHELADEKGGECLSNKYVNYNTDLTWRCKEGHEWNATPHNVIRGTWCPHCIRNVKLSIEEMHNIAKERGGECLSKEYINEKTKLRWRCIEGHEWEATSDNVKHGTWCPICGRVKSGMARRLNIEEMQEIAKSIGGECLSTDYITSDTKLRWKCEEGHEWEAIPKAVKRGQWCPHCARNARLSLEEMWEIARKRGGECLSERYINNASHLRWRCKEGHEWEAKPNNIKNGKWCPYCARKESAMKRRKHTIKDMIQIAKKRGGECLSKEYINSNTKLKWRCKEGHEWENTPSHIKSGQWCPQCARKR